MTPDDLIPLRDAIHRYCRPSQEEWREFAAVLQRRTLRPGDHFVEAGQVPGRLGFIVRGTMRRYSHEAEGAVVHSFLRAGSFASEYAALVLREPARQALDALEPTELLTVAIADLERLAERHPSWRAFAIGAGARAARRAEERFIQRVSTPPAERLTWLLTGWPGVFSVVRKRDVAGYLGVTPEHLSRLLARRRDSGRVAAGAQKPVIVAQLHDRPHTGAGIG